MTNNYDDIQALVRVSGMIGMVRSRSVGKKNLQHPEAISTMRTVPGIQLHVQCTSTNPSPSKMAGLVYTNGGLDVFPKLTLSQHFRAQTGSPLKLNH